MRTMTKLEREAMKVDQKIRALRREQRQCFDDLENHSLSPSQSGKRKAKLQAVIDKLSKLEERRRLLPRIA